MPMKTCPVCKTQSGPRTLKCACGHDFVTKKAAVPVPALQTKAVQLQEEQEPAAAEYGISTPAGPCPVKPAGFGTPANPWPDGPATDSDVLDWVDEVFHHGRKIGKNYLPQAIWYWAQREFWRDTGREELQRIRKLLCGYAAEENR